MLFFSAAFIGVDFFFVISGYLITALIDLKSNDFSLLEFYNRRLRRLMPAYLTFLLVTLSIGIFFFYSMLVEDLVSSTVTSMLGISNFHYMNLNYKLGYFIFLTMENPLIHTWSISVEFQFYLLWPVLLQKLKGPKSFIISILLLIFLGISEYWALYHTSDAFFMTIARIHQFMMGGLTWYLSQRHLIGRSSYYGIAGWILILISLFTLDKDLHHPGLNSLLPTLATALLLSDSETSYSNKFLSLAPLQFLGNISYSLYLYHWMIFVLFRFLSIEVEALETFVIIIISIFIATLSYYFIEKPCKRPEFYRSWKKILFPSIAFLIIVLYFIAYSSQYIVFPSKYDFSKISHLAFGNHHKLLKDKGANNQTYLVVGNSISYDLMLSLRKAGSRANYIRKSSTHKCYNFGTAIEAKDQFRRSPPALTTISFYHRCPDLCFWSKNEVRNGCSPTDLSK